LDFASKEEIIVKFRCLRPQDRGSYAPTGMAWPQYGHLSADQRLAEWLGVAPVSEVEAHDMHYGQAVITERLAERGDGLKNGGSAGNLKGLAIQGVDLRVNRDEGGPPEVRGGVDSLGMMNPLKETPRL
jgi:hypothetical protein